MWDPITWYGGAVGASISADYPIIDLHTRIFSFAPSADNWKVKMPDARRMSIGANVVVVVNEHATRVLLVCDSAGTTIATLTGHQVAKCSLEAKASAVGTWRTRVLSW